MHGTHIDALSTLSEKKERSKNKEARRRRKNAVEIATAAVAAAQAIGLLAVRILVLTTAPASTYPPQRERASVLLATNRVHSRRRRSESKCTSAHTQEERIHTTTTGVHCMDARWMRTGHRAHSRRQAQRVLR